MTFGATSKLARYLPAVEIRHIAIEIEKRDNQAPRQMLVSSLSKHTKNLQPCSNLCPHSRISAGKPVAKSSIGKAKAVVTDELVITNATMFKKPHAVF